MNDLISIVIPVYNVQDFLMKSIRSICSQTYSNLEIILVDDGSTDNSGCICEELSKSDDRIKVIHKENGGQGSARNRALDVCTGKYIYFHDSDDWIENDCIFYLYDLLKKYNSDVSVCNYRFVDEADNDYGLFSDLNIEKLYSGYDVIKLMWNDTIINIAPWGKLFKADLWRDFRFKECYCEDSATMYLFYTNEMKIVYGSKSKVNYLLRNNSDVRSFTEKKLYMLDIYEDVVQYAKKELPVSLQNAAISKQIAVNFHVLSQLPKGKYQDVKKRIIKTIKRNRKKVILDRNARRKNKLACLISYFGFGVVISLLSLFKKIKPSI